MAYGNTILDHIGYGAHDWWLKQLTVSKCFVITAGVWKNGVQSFTDTVFDSWDDAYFVFKRICANVVTSVKHARKEMEGTV